MDAIQARSAKESTRIEGHARRRRDTRVPHVINRKFGAVAKLLWPQKTAATLAFIGSADERTGKRWIQGLGQPPIPVILECVREMLRVQS